MTHTLSSIRTMTVGSGIAPDLLTRDIHAARGLVIHPKMRMTYRRWGISPRPENSATLP